MSEVANVNIKITADTQSLDAGLARADTGIQKVGASSVALGNIISQNWMQARDDVIGLGRAALTAAIDIDASMRNTQAVTGQTDAEIARLRSQVVGLSADFTATPREAAAAYYDIAGGVSDASARMSVFEQSMLLADAGQAELTTSTQGLISAVNSYGAAVLPAAKASDVYTRAVGMGVGTMDEFVAAMGPVAGMTATTKVGFEELGAAVAYQTTQGVSASMAATRLRGILTQLLKPNADLTRALKSLGYESGVAAIEQLGLAGTVQAVNMALGDSESALAKAFGDVEAIQGAVALTNENYNEFIDTFNSGLDGSTMAAFEQQSKGVNFQLDIMKGNFEAIGANVANFALPTLNEGLSQGNWMIDVLFPGPEEIQEKFQAAIGPIEGPAAITYQIKPGDTPQDVARELNITVQEAQRLMREQGGFVSVGVDPTLDGFAAKLGVTRDEAKRIAEQIGWNVAVPTTVTADMVLAEATKQGLDPNQPGVFEEIRKQLENNAAGGVTVDIPTNVNINAVAMQLSDATGLPYTDTQDLVNALLGGREHTSHVNVGAVITLQPRTADGKPFDFNAVMQRELAERAKGEEVIKIDAGDQQVALLVSAGIAVENFLMNSETSEEDQLKIYNTVQGWVDDIGPIEIDIADIALGVKNVFIANPLDLARDINDTLMGAANGVSDWADENIGTRGESHLAQYTNDWIAQRESNSLMYPRPTQQSGMMMDYVNPAGILENQFNSSMYNLQNSYGYPVGSPQEQFITAVLGPETDEGVAALIKGLELPTATANIDMTQAQGGFDQWEDGWQTWKDTLWKTNAEVYIAIYGAGPNGEGTAEGMDAGLAAVTRGIPQYAEGGHTGSGGLAMLHENEWVVPAGGMIVKPSRDGLVMEGGFAGGGGGGLTINGNLILQNVQNVEQLYDELQTVAKKRGR